MLSLRISPAARADPSGAHSRTQHARLSPDLPGHLLGFFEPLFYLFAMGYGVGALIGNVPLVTAPAFPTRSSSLRRCSRPHDERRDLRDFHNFFYKLKYAKLYDAIISTPMSLGDVARVSLWACCAAACTDRVPRVIAVLGLAGLGC